MTDSDNSRVPSPSDAPGAASSPPRVRSGFRRDLLRELPQWQSAGWIDEAAANALRRHYGLEESGTASMTTAMYIIGALLIGGGVISLVAWNWKLLSPWFKLGILVTALIVASATGGAFWFGRANRPRLGQALLFLGTLIFGAAVFLVGQIFHTGSNWYTGFGYWAIGATAGAWILRSPVIAVLALVITAAWAIGFGVDHRWYGPYGPYTVALVFLPLAYLLRSRILSFASAVGFALVLAVLRDPALEWVEGTIFGFTLAGLVWLAVSLVPRERMQIELQEAVRIAGFVAFVPILYLLTFKGIASDISLGTHIAEAPGAIARYVPLLLIAAAGIVVTARDPQRRYLRALRTVTTLVSAAVLTVLLLVLDSPLVLNVFANLALLAVAGSALAVSARQMDRGAFWFGNVLIGVLVISRFFELQTNLLGKSIGFLLSGVAVIVVGIMFERRLRGRTS